MSLQSQSAPPPLPIMEIAKESFDLLFGNLRAFLAAMLLPLIIELAVQYAMIATYGQDPMAQLQASLLQGKELDLPTFLRGLGINLAILIAYVLFAVSWHRFTLLREPPGVIPAVQARHLRFVLISIGISVLVVLISFVAAMIVLSMSQQSSIVMVLTAVVTVVVLVRVQLVFPAIALDQPITLLQSWRLTRGNGLRLFWLFVLVSLLPIFMVMIVTFTFLQPMARFALTRELELGAALGFILSGIAGYILVGLLVGAISGAYRRLVLAPGS